MLVGQTKRKLKQQLQPHQAYSAIYWKPKLKLRIRTEWEARHTGDCTNPANSGEYLRFMNQRLRELLRAESDDVKAEVEQFRTKAGASKPDDENDDPDNPLLHEHETDLPEHERERIKAARARQRCVSTANFIELRLTFSLSAVENLEGVLEEVAKAAQDEAGATILVLFAAPEPERNGQLVVHE